MARPKPIKNKPVVKTPTLEEHDEARTRCEEDLQWYDAHAQELMEEAARENKLAAYILNTYFRLIKGFDVVDALIFEDAIKKYKEKNSK
jgi:hypothetical protein